MIAPAFTRSSDWWEPKITLMIGLGLMVCYPYFQVMSLAIVGFLIQLLLALVAGAVYVSLINDYTDLEEDLAAGKSNRLQKIPPWLRKALIYILVAIIFLFIYLLQEYPVGLGFFIASKVAYTMYSFRPFRLKARGIWGVLADACGAHVFPTLGMFAFLSEYFTASVDWIAMLFLGVWSFLYGIRGILNHQYLDLEHDMASGGKTFACQFPQEKIKGIERKFVLAEVFSFAVLLVYFGLYSLLIALLVYFCYVWLIDRYTWYRFILIIQSHVKPDWNIFMAAYYQLAVPMTLIGHLVYFNSWFLLALVFFVILFPNEWIKNMQHIKALFKSKSLIQ